MNVNKKLMFVFCIRLQLRKLIALLVLSTAFLAWLSGILHGRLVKTYGNETVVDKIRLESEPHIEKDYFVSRHDSETAAHVSEIHVNDNVNSLQFNLSNASFATVSHSAERTATHHLTSCDQECLRFKNVMLSWPQDKPKAAVYYLTKATRLNLLHSSLTSLFYSFLYRFNYPVIVFHEADTRDLIREIFRNFVNIQLFFQEVEFDLPSHINASAVKFEIRCFSPISYRHMCRFHAKNVYEQAILTGLEYVWRLDDDSLLPAVINYDLFVFMRLHHFQYGYIKIHFDSYDCTTGLWEAVRNYIKQEHLQSAYFDKWTEPMIFYNNFEISALSLWTSKWYQDYVNFIDMLGGIYYYRWGDAPVKSIAVTLFVPEEATHLFTDVTYQHGSFFKNFSYSSF